MGVFDKFLDIMRLKDDDFEDDDFDDVDDFDDDFDAKPRTSLFGKKKNVEEDLDVDSRGSGGSGKVTPMRPVPNRKSKSSMEVCVIKPASVDDSREISETLLAGRTVILNLEGMDVDVAQRIIDFVSGATFALGGNLQRVSNYIFLLTPANVDISGDIQDLLGGSSDNQPMRSRY